MSLKIPSIKRAASATKTKLSIGDRESLYQLTMLPGYQVLLRLIEMNCILQDAELMEVDPSDEKRVLAVHRITLAKWEFFADFQKQIQFECNEIISGRNEGDKTDEQKEAEAKEREIEAIVDPLTYQE